MESTRLTCGCELVFLDDIRSDISRESLVVHQKPSNLLNTYEDLYDVWKMENFHPKRLLEIGVKYGGSLAWWKSILPDCHIVGIDTTMQIPNKTMDHFAHAGDIVAMRMDATSEDVLTLGKFDVIVDDGSHIFSDITASYELLWPSVNPGGFYIIEDWYAAPAESAKLIAHLTCDGPFPIIDSWASGEPNPKAPIKLMAWKHAIVLQKPSA